MKIYRSTGLLLLALLLLGACTDYLEVKPYGRTIPKTAEEFSALMHTHLNNIDQGTDQYIVGNASRIMDADVAWGDDFETCLTEPNGRTLGVYVGSLWAVLEQNIIIGGFIRLSVTVTLLLAR